MAHTLKNLLSPAFQLKRHIFLRLENPFLLFELVNFYPSLGIQEIRKDSEEKVFWGALQKYEEAPHIAGIWDTGVPRARNVPNIAVDSSPSHP